MRPQRHQIPVKLQRVFVVQMLAYAKWRKAWFWINLDASLSYQGAQTRKREEIEKSRKWRKPPSPRRYRVITMEVTA